MRVMKDLPKDVDPSPEGGKGKGSLEIRRRASMQRNALCKGPEVPLCSVCLRNRAKAPVVGDRGSGGRRGSEDRELMAHAGSPRPSEDCGFYSD